MARRTPVIGIFAASILALATGCGSEGSSASASVDQAELDALWEDISHAETSLKRAEVHAIVTCLEEAGFAEHNPNALSQVSSTVGSSPSELAERAHGLTVVPKAEKAADTALGIWVRCAAAYSDEDSSSNNDDVTDEEPSEDEFVLEEIEEAGEGWNELGSVERMNWEIAFQGEEWAATTKAASELSQEQWQELEGVEEGIRSQSDMDLAPTGCLGDALTEMHGVPESPADDSMSGGWTWGPQLPVLQGGNSYDLDLASSNIADEFTDCLSDSGYNWSLEPSGRIDYGNEWTERYLPAATENEGSGGTEFRESDITQDDVNSYYSTKDEEFVAAETVVECDIDTGYSEHVADLTSDTVMELLLDSSDKYQEYLSNLEDALAVVGDERLGRTYGDGQALGVSGPLALLLLRRVQAYRTA